MFVRFFPIVVKKAHILTRRLPVCLLSFCLCVQVREYAVKGMMGTSRERTGDGNEAKGEGEGVSLTCFLSLFTPFLFYFFLLLFCCCPLLFWIAMDNAIVSPRERCK